MRAFCLALFITAATACTQIEASKPTVDVDMRNVDLHVTPDIALHIRYLRGQFVTAGTRPAPFLDDPRSYNVTVDAGEVAVDLASLNAIMARTLKEGHSNVRSLQISVDEQGQLRQKGVVRKGIPLPFDVEASVSATPDGFIRIHSESIKGFGVPVNPLLKVLRVGMDNLFTIDPGHGVRVTGNDLLLDPANLLPPPGMRGKLTAVRVEKNALVQIFGSGEAPPAPASATAKNHIYWRGGQLSFGKLTMTETDLELVDDDPHDAFDFSVDRWQEQLVAGYSKTTTERGLKAHMPDYNDLHRRAR